jgi:superfamily II DNA or RNA helicase
MIKNLNEKPVQVLENLTGIAIGNGFVLPDGTDRKTWVTRKLIPSPEQDKYLTSFFESLLETERIRDYFVTQLKKTLNPKMYGIDRVWKLTQREALEAVIRSFEGWHTRPLIELPTGVGKSMLEGAIARAYYDTLRVFGLEDLFEIVICTSRIHIGDQMINKTTSIKSDEEDDDAPLDYGDVKMWFPFLGENDIRLLAGKSGSVKERTKKAKITIVCYAGLNEKSIDRLFTKKAGLVLLDESHRVTNRVRIMLENKMHTAFFVGGSATTKGAKNNNPFIFFEAMEPEKEDGAEILYTERLAYHASIALCVERGELKRIRYINASTHFDLSSVKSFGSELANREAAKFIAKNIPTMKRILHELFLGDQTVLTMVGSKSVIKRQWLVFVDRVSIAQELAEFCNTVLLPFVRKMYGDEVPFNASYVSGTTSLTGEPMPQAEFKRRMALYQNGEITIMFSSEKLGEGSDVPNINGVLSFRAYSRSSLWKAIQEIGRGTRFVVGEDLLVIDGVFRSNKHKLAALSSIFGLGSYLNGGLVAGYQGEREAEEKVFKLLKEGLTWKQVWDNLTDEEQSLVPFVKKFLLEPGGGGHEILDLYAQVPVKSIEFVFNETEDKILYSTYKEAQKAVFDLGIFDYADYRKRYIKDPKLPAAPHAFYKDEGWTNWAAFLGNKERNFYSTYKEAQIAVQKLEIKSSIEYDKRYKEDPKLPAAPFRVYENKGWKNWYVFLNKGDGDFYSYTQAKIAVKKMGINSLQEYRLRFKEDKKLPSSPKASYKNNGWVDFYVFLGRDTKNLYKTYKQAQLAVRKLGIKSSPEYDKKHKEDPKLPAAPYRIYKGKGWKNWYVFLDRGDGTYYSYKRAKVAVKKLGIKNNSEYSKKYLLDLKLPSNPQKVYSNDGWTGWSDFLGNKKREYYSTYQEAKLAISLFSISSKLGYAECYKKDSKLHSNPNILYKNKGWISWGDFLDGKI